MTANTTVARRGIIDSGQDALILIGIFAIAGITGGVWLTGQLAGLLFAWSWPDVSFTDGFEAAVHLPGHWGDPRQAWPEGARAELPGPIGFYISALLVFGVIGSVAVWAGRRSLTRKQVRGLASPTQLHKALSMKAALARAGRLRPSLTSKPDVEDVAVPLGRALGWGRQLWATIENSVILFAAPRQGKTSQVLIPWLAGWRGPALVTSVRADVIENTLIIRKEHGPVAVFDVSGEPWPHKLRWSPITGCEKFDVARQRADVMVSVGKSTTSDSENAGYFGMTATNLLAGWLHAAALNNRDMGDVLRWALDERISEPIQLLSNHPSTATGVTGMLDALYRSPVDTRSNMFTTVQTAVAPLLSEAARDTFCPSAGASFDVEDFLRHNGTIYLQVSENQAKGLAPLVSAFVDEILETVTRTANRSESGRLDPPLGFFGDEIANVAPLPNLPSLMSYAGGSGIFVVAVLQNIAQARSLWGRDGADMLWGAATTKIALGGLGGDELEEFSKLAGTYRETIITPQRGPHGTHVSASISDRKTLSAHEVRELDDADREALVIHSTTPATKTRMTRHYESARAKDYAASVKDVREQRSQASLEPKEPTS